MSERKINILIIDDSSITRRTLSDIIDSSGLAQNVWTARDGGEGLKKALEQKPDLITLDLEMPNMDGFTFLRILMKSAPTPTLVLSGIKNDKAVFRALEMGAVDFLAKPGPDMDSDLYDIKEDLLNKIKVVGQLEMDKVAARVEEVRLGEVKVREISVKEALEEEPRRAVKSFDYVLIGSSTGGPTALQEIFSAFPQHLDAAIAISQHMPAGFTKAFAQRLDKHSKISVKEASQGDKLKPGHALVAPGGYHMSIAGKHPGFHVELEKRAQQDKYVPSVDKLFSSGAKVIGGSVLGVILTGMGSDGKEGALQIKESGGQVIAESEKTAIVYGMPREVIISGAADEGIPLDRMANAILLRCFSPKSKTSAG